MADTWIVLVEDRHSDPDVRPFSTEERAFGYAREQMQAIVARPERIREIALTPAQRKSGWVLCLDYALAPFPLVRVIRRTMDDTGRSG